jgi:hypothetical protein
MYEHFANLYFIYHFCLCDVSHKHAAWISLGTHGQFMIFPFNLTTRTKSYQARVTYLPSPLLSQELV